MYFCDETCCGWTIMPRRTSRPRCCWNSSKLSARSRARSSTSLRKRVACASAIVSPSRSSAARICFATVLVCRTWNTHSRGTESRASDMPATLEKPSDEVAGASSER